MVDVDRTAPVRGSARVEIDAPPRVVWELLSDVEGWPEWNPDVRSARLEGPLAAGTRFRWKAGPGTITSELVEVRAEQSMAWRGASLGVRAVHVWRLEPAGTGTALSTEESMSGLPVRLFRRSLQRTLDRALETGLRAAKQEAERRARER